MHEYRVLRFILLEKSLVVLANCTVSVQPYSEKISEIAQIHILENVPNFLLASTSNVLNSKSRKLRTCYYKDSHLVFQQTMA